MYLSFQFWNSYFSFINKFLTYLWQPLNVIHIS